MAESLLGAWLDRFRGRLEPVPCPFSRATVLDMPLRRLVASPERLLGDFGIGSGDRVLEVGPGVGYYSVEAARRVGISGRLLCLDLQTQMLFEARRRFRAESPGRAHFITGSATRLPLASGSLDHIFLITVLGEIPDRGIVLAEFHPARKPPPECRYAGAARIRTIKVHNEFVAHRYSTCWVPLSCSLVGVALPA